MCIRCFILGDACVLFLQMQRQLQLMEHTYKALRDYGMAGHSPDIVKCIEAQREVVSDAQDALKHAADCWVESQQDAVKATAIIGQVIPGYPDAPDWNGVSLDSFVQRETVAETAHA